MTDRVKFGSTKTGTTIEPVVMTQLVDLDPFPVRGRMRHLLCRHRQRLVGADVSRQARVV